MNRRQELHARKNRLSKLSDANKTCSECPERKPTWASLFQPPVANGQRMGVLCCYKCYSFHFQLGKGTCSVKNMKMVEEWTDEELEALERGGGNPRVNAIYEALLKPSHYDKSVVLPDEDEDAASRRQFVRQKYQELKFFEETLYHQHIAGTTTCNSSEEAVPEGPATRRCKSFDDNHQHSRASPAEEDRSKDFVRKPMRRRSQSFKEETWDDDRESTDEDDQPVAYQMPGHLVGVGRRRQSMPLHTQTGPGNANRTNKPSSKERRQRRASIRESLHKEAQERRASQTGAISAPSNNDLGYGDDVAKDEASDVTCRRSNRRKSMSGRRRMSMPSVGQATHTNMNAAPKMPTRFVSDDSAAEESEFDAEDNFTDVEVPVAPPSQRLRRMSMPHVVPSSSDTEDEDSVAPAARLSDPFTGYKPTSLYGMDLGYGYDHDADDSSQLAKRTARIVTPRRMSRRGSSSGSNAVRRGSGMPRRGSSAGTQNAEAKSRSPVNLLGAAGDSGLSSEELESVASVDLARKEKRRSKKHSASSSNNSSSNNNNTIKEKRNRRTIRRCSTGGAIDKFGTEPQQCPAAIVPGESSSHETDIDLGYEEQMQNWVPPEPYNAHPAPKVARPMRRGSMGAATGASSRSKVQPAMTATVPLKSKSRSSSKSIIHSSKPIISTEDLGYGDLGYGPDARTIPSDDDLGYGNLDEQETSSREDIGYEDLGYGKHYGNSSQADERTPAMPAELRMPRRGSSAGMHHRPGRRLSSTQGGCEPRSSSRARRPSVGGALSTPQSNRRRRSSIGGGANSLPANLPNMLDSGRAALMRSDSVSSMCSEVSVNAALLYAGDKKLSNNQGTGSDGLVSVMVVSTLYQSESEDPGLDYVDDDDVTFSSEATEPVVKRQSKKDYWKAKLAEKSKAEARKDIDILSSNERRARRRLSVGLAA